MNEDRHQRRKRFRSNNIPRLLIGLGALTWFHQIGMHEIVFRITTIIVAYIVLWTTLIELNIGIIYKENLRYLRLIIDSCGLTIGILITGGASSPGIVTYAGTAGLASLYISKRFGVFSIATNVTLFNAMLFLVHEGILPRINVLAPDGLGSESTMAEIILANIMMILYSIILHLVIQPNYRNLHTERAELKARNDAMHREITLARRIQEKLIPARSPDESIAFLYKPMDQVGGDFFDFIEHDGKIGIFLCDVSGHGVPAALIASMMKTIVLQAGHRASDPATFMSYINETLQSRTAGNFVTAFYASFQKSSRSIVYCNAGHCSPYVIDQTGVRELEGVKSVPLGLWSNDELRLRNRAFSNVEINLIADSRILFYTDGLTETRCENGDLMFEEGPLQENLVATRQQTSAAAVEDLHRALARFHGSNSFEDDVCVICLDIK